MRDLARGLATLLAVATGTTALVAVGWIEPSLALPLAAPASILAWSASVGPAVATFAGFRLVAIAAGMYLVVVLVLAAAARGAGRGHIQRRVTTFVPHSLRGPVALLAGVCVAASSASGAGIADATTVPLPANAHASSSAPGTTPASLATPSPTPAPVGRAESRRAHREGGEPRIAPPPVLSPLGPAPRSAPTHQPAHPLAAPRRRPAAGGPRGAGPSQHDEPPPGRAADAPVEAGVWVVQPGQSFWSIAEAVLGFTGSESAADLAAVASYWSRLIATNQQHLPIPGDPDLLFVGDRLVLPRPR